MNTDKPPSVESDEQPGQHLYSFLPFWVEMLLFHHMQQTLSSSNRVCKCPEID